MAKLSISKKSEKSFQKIFKYFFSCNPVHELWGVLNVDTGTWNENWYYSNFVVCLEDKWILMPWEKKYIAKFSNALMQLFILNLKFKLVTHI